MKKATSSLKKDRHFFSNMGQRINIGSAFSSLGDFTYTADSSKLLLDLTASAVYAETQNT